MYIGWRESPEKRLGRRERVRIEYPSATTECWEHGSIDRNITPTCVCYIKFSFAVLKKIQNPEKQVTSEIKSMPHRRTLTMKNLEILLGPPLVCVAEGITGSDVGSFEEGGIGVESGLVDAIVEVEIVVKDPVTLTGTRETISV